MLKYQPKNAEIKYVRKIMPYLVYPFCEATINAESPSLLSVFTTLCLLRGKKTHYPHSFSLISFLNNIL